VGSDSGFFQGWPRIFPGGAKNDEISFNPLETKTTTYFAKYIKGKCQIQNLGGKGPPLPPPDTYVHK